MIDINKIATNLKLSDSGIWFSRKTHNISYPEKGNITCFGIEGQSFWYQHRNKCVSKIMTLFPPGGAVFDIGGGNGIVSAAIQQLGIEVCLVEPGLDGVLNASKRGLRNVVHSTLEDSGFKKDAIPAVGLFDVLEHIENDCFFLETLNRVMMKKGRLFVSVPAFNFLWSKNDEHLGHFRRYELNALCAKLEKAGFAVDYSTYYFALLPIPILLYRTIPSRLDIYRDITYEVKQKEHRVKKNRLNSVIAWILDKELTFIIKGRPIPFGSSCLVVANKL